jgi:hypothetical protein
MNKNYKLLVIDRYNIGQSECYILPASFMKKFVQYLKRNFDMGYGAVVRVEGGFMGCDSEETSYLWMKTDRKVNSKSRLWMDDMYDLWEEESW